MFSKIEELYKKESARNQIIRKSFKFYITAFIVMWLFTVFVNPLFAVPIVFILLLIIKRICEKELGMKFCFTFRKKDKNNYYISDAINDQEINLFKKYVIENKMYNEKNITNIIEHYRGLNQNQEKNNNFLAILSTLISIITPFLNKDNFNMNNIGMTITFIISIVIIYLMLYWLYKEIFILTKSLKGEENIYQRIEEIFSELLNEIINKENKEKNKKTKKHKNKK